MKVKNRILKAGDDTPKQTITLARHNGEPLVLTVAAMPLTWNQDVLRFLPNIPVPRKVRYYPGTNRVMRDSNKQPILDYDEQDAEYVRKDYVRMQRFNAWMAFEALRYDDDVSFDNAKPQKLTKDNVPQWLDALNKELTDAGIQQGDMVLIIGTVHTLSNLTMEQVESERDGFLPQPQPEKDGSSQRTEPDEPSDT